MGSWKFCPPKGWGHQKGGGAWYVFRYGLRLEEMSDQFVDAVHRVLQASLSPSGYVKVRDCLSVNHFLGEVVNGPRVLNSRSYNFTLFDRPCLTKPWGWQLTGHQLCMNCFILGSQQVITPVFMGAEPNYIDHGKWQNMSLFDSQELAGLEVMKVLPPTLRDEVQIYKTVNDPTIPEWRIHRADQRHLGGAFQDNRVIPYEGCLVCKFPTKQQDMIRKIARLSLDYLPQDTLNRKMAEMERHWDETYFCWIGGWGLRDAFYYKIHSPVVMLEFDHHTGVFLSNRDPKPFHIHTTVRTPNGNDYGKALLRQYQDRTQRLLGD
ncbi:hypothetical protein BKA56DRAFT_499664 [Ilyonectria sp. MPI-CAGE-AT-0026]|nr:hypothetical protein BKA56DRAFT_499664 [Ilyonectria sp. MPI-CAGE-AT-0026]